jgi:hypothetical protein
MRGIVMRNNIVYVESSGSENIALKEDIIEVYEKSGLDSDFGRKAVQYKPPPPDLFSYTYHWFK